MSQKFGAAIVRNYKTLYTCVIIKSSFCVYLFGLETLADNSKGFLFAFFAQNLIINKKAQVDFRLGLFMYQTLLFSLQEQRCLADWQVNHLPLLRALEQYLL